MNNQNPIATLPKSRQNLAYLRHELRTALTGVLGYTEYLLEIGASLPPTFIAALERLRGIGRGILTAICETLDDATRREPSPEQPADNFSTHIANIMKSVRELEIISAELVSMARESRAFETVPMVCRIQASCVMLKQLLLHPHRPELSKTMIDSVSVDHPIEAAASSRHRPEGKLIGVRVLIADDNSVNRDVLRRGLTAYKYEVEEIDRGSVALDLARSGHFDVLLLDVIMPDLDGLGVLVALKQEEKLGLFPIIMLSAADDAPLISRCLDHGASDYINKPFNVPLLHARIQLHLELARLRRRERAYVSMLEEARVRPPLAAE